MYPYLYPVSTAMLQFPVVAFLLTIPYAIYCYRKYGSISALRSLIFFSFVFYLQCALYMTTLPPPAPGSLPARVDPPFQLIPFNFIYSFVSESSLSLSDPSSYLRALTEGCFLQPLLNVMMTLPFGVYLTYYFKKKRGTVVIYSLLLSSFFEIAQLTGFFWIYPYPYRLFDVDDLMLNTLGGLAGSIVSLPLTRFLPVRDRIDSVSRERASRVSFTRRFFAFLFDAMLIGAFISAAGAITGMKPLYLNSVVFFAYFVAAPVLLKGGTIGKMIVKIRGLTCEERKSLTPRLALRYASRGMLIFFAQLSSNSSELWLLMLCVCVLVLCLLDFLLSFRRGKRLWYELLSGTRNEHRA